MTDRQTGYPSEDKPWLKYYTAEAIETPLPECSIYEYMKQGNQEYPGDIAINYLGRKITYGELFNNIDTTAASFLAFGVQPGDIVTIALPSIPEALYCVYALNKIGAVANMIHPLAGKEEIIHYINEVKSRIVVIMDGAYDIISSNIPETTAEHIVVASPGDSLPFMLKTLYRLKVKSPKLDGDTFQDWQSFIKAGKGRTVNEMKRDCHKVALISHTGGTTGEPKGVMCSDYNINSLIYQSHCCFKHDERQHKALVVLPPFINYSLVQSMLEMLYLGYTVILLPKYEPDKIWDYLDKYHPNVVLSIPAYWEKLLCGSETKTADMSYFEQIYYGGEAMKGETEKAINEVLKRCGSKIELLKGLGSTELMSVASQTYPWCNDIGSVGVPLVKMNCKIIQPETCEELKYREQGEICFSGPTLMMGYYNNTQATEEVIRIHEDGERWLHTGDLGYMDEKGVVFVTGRIKRIIMTKGKDGQVTKMFPDRIEKAIYSDPAVELCCIIGIPDEERINYPKAFVVLKDSSASTEKHKSEIFEACKKLLPDYSVPEVIDFCEDLPRTERGKIDYRALEEQEKRIKTN